MLNRLTNFYQQDKELLTVAVKVFIARGTAAIGTLCLNLALAKWLGAAGVGLFMLCLSIVVGLATLARFGTDNAVLRFAGIACSEKNTALYLGLKQQSMWLCGGTSIILALILIAAREIIAVRIFNEPALAGTLLPMALMLPFYTFIYMQATLLKALREPVKAPFFETGSVSFVTALLVTISVLIGHSVSVDQAVWLLLVAAVAVYIAGRLCVSKSAGERFGDLLSSSKVEYKKGFLKILPDYAWMNIASYFVQWCALLILGAFVTSDEVGVYSVAQRLAFLVNFVLMVFNGLLAPRFATLYYERKHDELKVLARRSTLYMGLFSLPIVFSFVLFPKYLLGLFGDEFVQGSSLLVILALAQFINVATGAVGFLLNMSGEQRQMRNILFISAALVILLSALLSPHWGALGAALATAFALIIQNVLAVLYAYRKLGVLMLPAFR